MSLVNIATIFVGGIFNYFVIYKKSWFFGNMVYLLLGVLMAYQGSQLITASDANLAIGIGIIIILSTLINMALGFSEAIKGS